MHEGQPVTLPLSNRNVKALFLPARLMQILHLFYHAVYYLSSLFAAAATDADVRLESSSLVSSRLDSGSVASHRPLSPLRKRAKKTASAFLRLYLPGVTMSSALTALPLPVSAHTKELGLEWPSRHY